MTAPTKSLGQIAYEASPRSAFGSEWHSLSEERKRMWERIASAVAASQQRRIAAWLLEQPDMCTTDSQAALAAAAHALLSSLGDQ